MNESTVYGETAVKRPRRLVRELPVVERPLYRLQEGGPRGMSSIELLALMLGTPDALDLAGELLIWMDGLDNLTRFTAQEFMQVHGVGEVTAARLVAIAEIGRRVMQAASLKPEPTLISSPADAANYLMSEMMNLEQEHLRVILLNTRNHLIAAPTVYCGNVNTSIIRIGEIMREGIKRNAAAMIVAHNHPSGDPSPSPEDIRVTRELIQAGKLIGIDVLDHVIIGKCRFTSMRERGLGFD